MIKANNLFPSPRTPHIPIISSYKQLMPIARTLIKRRNHSFLAGMDLKPGEKVLILGDSTLDPLVSEALSAAIREAGGKLNIINLEGYPSLQEPVELVDTMFSRNWLPDWSWAAINQADVLLQGVFLKMAHTPNLLLKERGLRVVEMEWTSDLLASDYEHFPVEIRDVIDKKSIELYEKAREIRITDPEGTDLTFIYTPEDWQNLLTRYRQRWGMPGLPGHLLIPLPLKNARGILATSSLTFGGPIPGAFLTIEGGKVTTVDGGGEFGERLKESFDKYATLQSSACPGPGANWITTLGIFTHPKARRSPAFEKMSGSGRMHAWAFGHRRSGVIHASIGEAIASSNYKIIRHMDIYFATMIADGKKVIDKGHLKALDDTQVRAVAAKYGDPDKLLKEDWIPAVSGINIP